MSARNHRGGICWSATTRPAPSRPAIAAGRSGGGVDYRDRHRGRDADDGRKGRGHVLPQFIDVAAVNGISTGGKPVMATNVDRLYLRTVPSRTIVVARSFSLDGGDTSAVIDPAPTAPVILLRLGPYRFLANAAAQACHSTRDGPTLRLPGSPPSFLAWPCSPSFCFPCGRIRQEEA
jgi:hypothetical protein